MNYERAQINYNARKGVSCFVTPSSDEGSCVAKCDGGWKRAQVNCHCHRSSRGKGWDETSHPSVCSELHYASIANSIDEGM